MSIHGKDGFEIDRITKYLSFHVSQKRFFENEALSSKRFNVYSLSTNHVMDDALVTEVLNLRFQILRFTKVTKLDVSAEGMRPTVFLKWTDNLYELFQYPEEFLKRCCVLEMRQGVAPITVVDYKGRRKVPPPSNKRKIPVNGVDIGIYPLYIVPSPRSVPDYTNDANEISLYKFSKWLSKMTGMALTLDLPDHLSFNVTTRGIGPRVTYDDPDDYYKVPSQAQDFEDDPIEPLPQSSQNNPPASPPSQSQPDEDWFSWNVPLLPASQVQPSSSSMTTPIRPSVPQNNPPAYRQAKRLYHTPYDGKPVDFNKLLLLDEDDAQSSVQKPDETSSQPSPDYDQNEDASSSESDSKFQRIEDFL